MDQFITMSLIPALLGILAGLFIPFLGQKLAEYKLKQKWKQLEVLLAQK